MFTGHLLYIMWVNEDAITIFIDEIVHWRSQEDARGVLVFMNFCKILVNARFSRVCDW